MYGDNALHVVYKLQVLERMMEIRYVFLNNPDVTLVSKTNIQANVSCLPAVSCILHTAFIGLVMLTLKDICK